MGDTGAGVMPDGQPLKGASTGEDINLRGRTPSFRWSHDAVRRLDEEVEWALASNPTGAAEITGILMGKNGPNMEITDCEPVFLMHPEDHAYALTALGKRVIERTLAAMKSIPENELSVIGFYRSHIGPRFDLTKEDFDLMRTCFRDSSHVALLIELTNDGSSRLRLYVGDQSQALCEFHASENTLFAVPRWLVLWHNLSAEGPANGAGPQTRRQQTRDVPEGRGSRRYRMGRK